MGLVETNLRGRVSRGPDPEISSPGTVDWIRWNDFRFLRATHAKIYEIALLVGYDSESSFSKAVVRQIVTSTENSTIPRRDGIEFEAHLEPGVLPWALAAFMLQPHPY